MQLLVLALRVEPPSGSGEGEGERFFLGVRRVATIARPASAACSGRSVQRDRNVRATDAPSAHETARAPLCQTAPQRVQIFNT